MILLLHWLPGGRSLYNERDKKASYFVITFLLSPQIISCQYSNLKKNTGRKYENMAEYSNKKESEDGVSDRGVDCW